MFHVGSSTLNPCQFYRPCDKHEILVDNVYDDAFSACFTAVELDADASDLYACQVQQTSGREFAGGSSDLRLLRTPFMSAGFHSQRRGQKHPCRILLGEEVCVYDHVVY